MQRMKPAKYFVKIWTKGYTGYLPGSWNTYTKISDKSNAIALGKQLLAQKEKARVYYKGEIIWSYLDAKKIK